MIRPTLGYMVKMGLLLALALGVLGWLFASRLRELDALSRLENSVGLSQEWHDRVADIERRFPFTEEECRLWGGVELDAYLAVKQEISMYALPVVKRFPDIVPGQTAEASPPSPQGALKDLITLRKQFLLALERHQMAVSEYDYLDAVARTLASAGGILPPEADVTDAQRQIVSGYAAKLGAVDTSGFELFGLPRP